MENSAKPMFLFADSQLLFWRQDEELFLQRVREIIDSEEPKAAYIGASNDDRPEFFELFRGAMQGIGVHNCRMVPSEPSRDERAFIGRSDIIMLAGGDVHEGNRRMRKSGVADKVIQRYYEGALLMGVSAGAVQMGLFAWPEGDPEDVPATDLPEMFKLLPYLIDVHDEPDWPRMQRLIRKAGEHMRGLGIPTGGGAIIHPDLTVEPIRHPVVEFKLSRGQVRQALLMAPEPGMPLPEPGEPVPPPQVLTPEELHWKAIRTMDEEARQDRERREARRQAATPPPADGDEPAPRVLEPEVLGPDPLGLATPERRVRQDEDEPVN